MRSANIRFLRKMLAKRGRNSLGMTAEEDSRRTNELIISPGDKKAQMRRKRGDKLTTLDIRCYSAAVRQQSPNSYQLKVSRVENSQGTNQCRISVEVLGYSSVLPEQRWH